jgi:hypothetical protein
MRWLVAIRQQKQKRIGLPTCEKRGDIPIVGDIALDLHVLGTCLKEKQ